MPLNNKRDPNPAQNQPGRQLSSALGSSIPLLLLLLCRISLFGLFCVLLPAWLHKKWNLLVPVGIVALAEQIIIMDASSSSPTLLLYLRVTLFSSPALATEEPSSQYESPKQNLPFVNTIRVVFLRRITFPPSATQSSLKPVSHSVILVNPSRGEEWKAEEREHFHCAYRES